MASKSIIIGFHVRPNFKAKELAQREHIDIRIYKIIYDAINDVKQALEGLLEPEKIEESIGNIEVRNIFKVPKVGTVAGCHVLNGKITRADRIRLVRDGQEIYDGRVSSLKRFKDDVREVLEGFECGVGIENFNDIKVGDIIEVYKIVEVKRKLA
jgi:translation initiation factor IF-2